MSTSRRSLAGKQKGTPTGRTPNTARAEDSPSGNVASRSTATVANTSQSAEPMEVDTQHALDDVNISDDEEGGTRIGDIYIPPPIPPHCSTESKGPRLIISKIENYNFKSYAGKVVLGPFHHSFTAIIGPNGSGKSNVIDSMLFVFGYRANKIRCKKISTLLHNSAKHPDTQMCSVAVHFHQVEGEEGTKLPNTEIVIQRTAYRDNSSFYTINGRRVQFKEVAKLLKQHGVDLDHNRFLILQGEVESIAMMKPKGQTENETGMLEYLEDIIGTTRYIEPLAKIHQRVEQLTEERIEKHNRCKVAERDMKDLEEPYNEAIEYLRQENEHTRTKNLRIQKYLSDKNKKLEQITKEHEAITNELKEHDDKVKELENERKEKEAAVSEEMAAFEKLRKAKDGIEKKLEKAKSHFTEIQQTMKATNQRRKQNKTQLEKLDEKLVELRKIPSKNEKEISECEEKVSKLEKQKTELENELQKNYTLVQQQNKPLIEEREKFETELLDLKKNVDDAKRELKVSEQELKILKQDETTETRKYETLRSSYEEFNTKLEEQRSKIQELEQTYPDFEVEIATKNQQIQVLQKNEQNMRTQLLEKRGEINEKMVSMKTTRSNNRVLDFLMRQKNEGNVPGILGRLGDLGGIDAKYDVAISTCCGRLENIVVETVDTAQQCISLLREHDVGRASFIALEKVQHWIQQAYPIKTPENAPRLYDLVRVEDERVKAVFFFALRNTLVANDLDQGTRIAYGTTRYRVVTLDGSVIETSGSMTGGGRTQIRGRMGTKVQTVTKPSSANSSIVTQKALDELQRAAEELQSKINYNQEEQSRLDREVQTLQHNSQKNAAELKMLRVSMKSLEEQLPRTLKQLQTQKKRMEQTTTDAAKVKQLENDIEINSKNLEETETAAGKVTKKINEIQKKIDEIRNEKVKSVQNKISGLETQIKKLNGNITKLKAQVTTSERDVAKTEKQIEDTKADIVKAEEELTQLCEQRTAYDNETVELSKELEEATKAIDNAKSGASDMRKAILEIQKKESDMKLKRVEIDQKMQTITTKLAETREQIPRLKQQLKPLRLHEIPGDSEPITQLKTYTEEELAGYTLQDLQYKESIQEEQLKKKPNLSCIVEYIQKREIYLQRVGVLEDITAKRNQMRALHADVHKKRTDEFNSGYHIITRKLKEMYQMITQGGDAELELVDSMDPFQGVTFSVRPPKKTWKNISNLSGGEKTLSSLALVFALHYYKPSPLYFMDEIDAALDFKNISIVAHYIKLSDYLVGIYKVRDCTDSVAIKNVPPPMPLQPSQQTQNITMSQAITQTAAIASNNSVFPTQINYDENSENMPNSMERIPQKSMVPLGTTRETTFMPPSESTAISQQNNSSTTSHSQI